MSRRPTSSALAQLFAGQPMVRFPVPLSHEERQALDRLAARRGVARAQLIREAVDQFLASERRARRKRARKATPQP